ncbi:MAG: hypothetical protein V4660_16635 [Pseudomonadota bacterium]
MYHKNKIIRIMFALNVQAEMRNLTWTKTAEYGTFMTSFPKNSILISKSSRENESRGDNCIYSIKFLNEDGNIIEEMTNVDLENEFSNSLSLMKQTYEYARRQAMGLDDALIAILAIIDPDIPF